MKYKYRKMAVLGEWLLVGLGNLVIAIVVYFIFPDEKAFKKNFFGGLVLYFTFIAIYSGELLNKYVELSDECVRFCSFRFKKIKNTVSLSVKYDDILSIDAKTLPLVGVWAISVNTKNFSHKIPLSFCFCKHKEMFENLCKLVKQHNPNAYIDIRLTELSDR